MSFGALKPCKECGGQLAFCGNGYKCTGNVSEWAKCLFFTQTPDRKAFKIPKEYHDVDFLKKYKYVKRDRVFSKEANATAASTSAGLVSSAAEGTSSSSGARPLHGMRLAIIGKTGKSKAEITKSIQELGGSVVTKVDKTVAVCISTKAEVDKKSKNMQQAKSSDVHVVDEGFLEQVKKGGAALLIKQHSIAPWGGDPLDRIGDVIDGPKKSGVKSAREQREEAYFTKSVPQKMKMMVKGGAAVDPDSGMEDKAHVLQEKSVIYNAVLGLVDLTSGTNSYYKLQILESDKGSSYWVFRSWGRVGTTVGSNKIERFGSKNSAMENFLFLYEQKTGNDWENRNNFTKVPNKFFPLDIDYGGEEETVKQLSADAGSRSKLPKPVQDLVKMIFDVESMKKAMLEFEIDLKKMPLGKLSKKQIEQAYSVLTELTKLIEDKASQGRFLDASNRFYTLIPHDFGMKKPPLLDTLEIVKNKTEMLDNLLEIEVAYSMLKSGDEGGKDPLDVHYEKLKTGIEVLDKETLEFEQLQTYLKNTHAKTHSYYELELEEIYKIEREGEKKRYKPFKALNNRKLLWHGSRTTNYAGILSQGLRIAPPEAPVTGYMFGKGVYFADMVSKSANYCNASKSNPTGLLLLCEVALGNMHELTGASYITKLPKGTHSTKGCGMTSPDPKGGYVLENGVEIPAGEGKQSNTARSSLLYNEYIVYDVAQINMKYLIKCDFKFKW